MHRMRRLVALASLALIGAPLGSGTASAALIRPDAGRAYPDIAADINGVVNYTYNDATGKGTFNVTNTPYLIAGGPTSAQEFGVTATDSGVRQQILNITLDKTGAIVNDPSNSYALYGTVQAQGQTYSGLLLSGTPMAFGSQDLDNVPGLSMDVFDANVKITGGALAKFFGDNAYIQITPELYSTFHGKFDQNFSAQKATSNTRSYESPQPFPVPEPTTVLVLVVGGLGLVRHHRRRFAAR